MATIRHASHDHPLVLYSNKRKIHGAVCYGCKLCVRGEAYECVSCKFCLHKACVEELPPVIQQHPLHPSHPLTLFHHSPYGPAGFKCHNC
ncbi:hypothetical protein HS088_TW23G00235 [Tripterygium wilfordii]|uniref:Phorbol-ester/DAG-type domain-containing protein n=1 Tax=Tripterygium wilfordii TaxID=458696 RepID=A0A7J7BU93_TRIWF|nr:hypothetical protein HS088_TW23G00235 [Tripterygium wilfordii]